MYGQNACYDVRSSEPFLERHVPPHHLPYLLHDPLNLRLIPLIPQPQLEMSQKILGRDDSIFEESYDFVFED